MYSKSHYKLVKFSFWVSIVRLNWISPTQSRNQSTELQ